MLTGLHDRGIHAIWLRYGWCQRDCSRWFTAALILDEPLRLTMASEARRARATLPWPAVASFAVVTAQNLMADHRG